MANNNEYMIVEFNVKLRVSIDPNDDDAQERTAELLQAALENGITSGHNEGTLTDDRDEDVIVLEEGVTLNRWYLANGEIPL